MRSETIRGDISLVRDKARVTATRKNRNLPQSAKVPRGPDPGNTGEHFVVLPRPCGIAETETKYGNGGRRRMRDRGDTPHIVCGVPRPEKTRRTKTRVKAQTCRKSGKSATQAKRLNRSKLRAEDYP